MKKNNLDIPLGFLADRNGKIVSTLFAFNDYLSLSSYVPKKNKAVVLLSSKHHTETISEANHKPQMIIDYNKMKG
jgi:hypothetical protein